MCRKIYYYCYYSTYAFCFAVAGMLGFFLSWQYGSCYSWLAQKLDITGKIAPIFMIGCGIGGFVFPPLSGFVFTWDKWGPVGILHLTLIVCVIHLLVYSAMYAISRKRISNVSSNDESPDNTGAGEQVVMGELAKLKPEQKND